MDQISLLGSLNTYPEFAPLLIGLIFISAYMVLNFGLALKFNKKNLDTPIAGKKHMSWFFLRNILMIALSPLLHIYTILTLSEIRIDNITLESFAPDFVVFQVIVTLFLSLMLFVGYSFPEKIINSIIFSPWTFFVVSYKQPISKRWAFLRTFLRLLNQFAIGTILILLFWLLWK